MFYIYKYILRIWLLVVVFQLSFVDLVLFGCFARSVRMARLISIFEDWCDGRRLIIRDKVLHQTHIYLIYYPNLLIDAVHLTMNAIEIQSLTCASHWRCTSIQRSAGTLFRQQAITQVHRVYKAIVSTDGAKLLLKFDKSN